MFDLEEVKKFIENSSEETKIYFGADSISRKSKNGKQIAEYAVVVVVHKDGRHGAKVFGYRTIEQDFDFQNYKNSRRNSRFVPTQRLMREVELVSDLYNKLVDSLFIGPDGEILENGRHYEIHMDFSKDEKNASSQVLKQAVGYIMGVCGVEPKFKPDSFAATHCADRLSKQPSYLVRTLDKALT